MDFVGADMKRSEEIAATVADNFTKKEIRKMTKNGDVIIIHGKGVVEYGGADAEHEYRTATEPSEVHIEDSADKTAITHEFVHHMRVEDEERTGDSRTFYKLDEEGCVNGDEKPKPVTLAEEFAVTAETEIRTRERTTQPNSYLGQVDRQIDTSFRGLRDSLNIERSTLRTKKSAIKNGELIPVFEVKTGDDVMAEGTNLRGERCDVMFKRNFKRSRLGNAASESLKRK